MVAQAGVREAEPVAVAAQVGEFPVAVMVVVSAQAVLRSPALWLLRSDFRDRLSTPPAGRV